jgi:uroporphyrinogen-III decarboxylase
MMSPALYARLVTPYLRRLIRLAHDGGMLTALHCHGRVREVFPEILRTGADLLEPIEPPNQGNIPLAELMRQAHGRICLMGHIQDQEFYTASPGFMTKRVEQIAKVVRGRTGYIMSPTCTPFEFPCSEIYRRNYLEWLEAAERLLAAA